MTRREIKFGKPWITDAERQAVLEVLDGDVLTHGPQSKAFEREFETFVGGEAHALTMSSGMAALHLSYWQLGIGAGDEVVVTAQTHVATAHAVEAVGARPVFVDCRPGDGNIDPELIERAITPRTRAIGLVHFLGIPCDMDAILSIAGRHGLKVIEDCALAVGARIDGRHVGLFGDAGIFSFYPVKHITTGDGGMFLTRHKELAGRVARARAFGVDRDFAQRTIPGMYDVPTLGLNYRLSDINAALGRKQLDRIETILDRRRRNFDVLRRAVAPIPNISVIEPLGANAQSSHYCLSIVLEGALATRRDDAVIRLNGMGVGTSVYYPHPVPRLTYYRSRYGYDPEAWPQAARISDQSIALPVGPHLDETDMTYIAECLAETVRELTA